ncbi:MAG: HAD family hydrolase [Firmicutes bacterium]|nr:HAD family hydrolase [Bacillota bacterium]
MNNLIFDLDGTLTDSLPLIIEAQSKALQEAGVEPDREKIISYIGYPLLQTGEELLGPGRGWEYVELYQKYYKASGKKPLPFPGIREMLDTLRRHGCRLAVATSKRQAAAMESLSYIGEAGLFDAVVTAESGCGCKPGPGPALKAMELLSAPPESTVFVGDSLFDWECAHAAGVAFVGVAWGAVSGDRLRQAGAETVAESVEELTAILLRPLPAPAGVAKEKSEGENGKV